MRTTEIKYTKWFNTGNYEHEEMAIIAVLDESGDEDAAEELVNLKQMVQAAHDKEVGATDTKEDDEEEVPAEEPEEEEKPARGKKASKKKEEEEPEEKEQEEEEEEEPAKPARGSKFKKKGEVYSREKEQHKAIIAEKLNELFPNWKVKKAAKAKELSKTLQGKEFLDADGEILESFVSLMKKGMK